MIIMASALTAAVTRQFANLRLRDCRDMLKPKLAFPHNDPALAPLNHGARRYVIGYSKRPCAPVWCERERTGISIRQIGGPLAACVPSRTTDVRNGAVLSMRL
jgi:hypothetical protein